MADTLQKVDVFHEDGVRPVFAQAGFAGQSSPLRDTECAELWSNQYWLASRSRAAAKTGGARRDRTADLLIANEALSQLSYGP
jgi:hypothetical protein